MEFFVDFKGGKCNKVANNRKLSSASNSNNLLITSSNSTKDNNNNTKDAKEKEKERVEVIDLVGSSRSAFVVSFFRRVYYFSLFKTAHNT